MRQGTAALPPRGIGSRSAQRACFSRVQPASESGSSLPHLYVVGVPAADGEYPHWRLAGGRRYALSAIDLMDGLSENARTQHLNVDKESSGLECRVVDDRLSTASSRLTLGPPAMILFYPMWGGYGYDCWR